MAFPGMRRRVFGYRIVGHDENEDAFIERRPAQDVVLSQAPLFVKTALEMHEVASLAQGHLLRKACKLVEIRRVVGNTPNTGLRQVVKFHAFARSDFRATPLFSTVRASVPFESKAVSDLAQVLWQCH